jgi:hypothetical protein
VKLSELLGDPAWLFDLGFPIRFIGNTSEFAKPQELDWELDDSCKIPPLGSLTASKHLADMSLGWNDSGLLIHVSVRTASNGKKERTDPIQMQFFLDTRRSPDVHRGTTYCHRFNFILPAHAQRMELVRGHGEQADLQRARAKPADIHPKDISVGILARDFGSEIKIYLKGDTLTGFQPREFQEIGVHYVLHGVGLGSQSMARSIDSSYYEDPSVWCSGKLIQPLLA